LEKEGRSEEKMRTIAVICEYNPFHEGHQYLIERARALYPEEETAVVCVMSGDFVQRGEPAIYDKYSRAERALRGGADLVLELPTPYSCSVAEHFASAAISIICRLGVVDDLAFGSEGKDEEALLTVGRRITSEEFLAKKEEYRKEHRNFSYPKMLDGLYCSLYGSELALSSNEILGVQYLLSLQAQKKEILPHAIPMLSGVCASSVRKELKNAPDSGDIATLEEGERAILSMLTLSRGTDRFSAKAPSCKSLGELFEAVRNSNDTDARLKRELLFTLFSLPSGYEKTPPAFTVLLGANEKGRGLLSEMEKKGTIPVISKQSAGVRTVGAPFEEYLRLQSLYALFTREAHHGNYLFEKRPIIL
jgi:cytidyltransferase-like protein